MHRKLGRNPMGPPLRFQRYLSLVEGRILMMVQLRLLDGGRTPVWKLDADARQVGLAGVAKARAALAAARTTEPKPAERRAG